MILRVENMKMATGGPLIAVISEQDAEQLDVHNGDRIRIQAGSRSIVAKIDIAERKGELEPGRIGLLYESMDALKAKHNLRVRISVEPRPESISYIRKKLAGIELTDKEINQIVADIVENKLDDIELTYFVSASTTHLMTVKETISFTKAMIRTGEVLKLRSKPVVDKHCIGGVAGNRTTMIIVPIIASTGLVIPKTSSRSITSPAGTADTMECLAKVHFTLSEMKKILKDVGACIVWGGAINLAPADDRIIRVEHPIRIDSESQLIASILAKKASVSATHVLLDIPVGRGAKIESRQQASHLKNMLELIARKIGMKARVVLTDGSNPIGNGFGPMLEARDVLWVLLNDPRNPYDLKEKSVRLSGELLEMVGKCRKGEGRKLALEILESGMALEKMHQIVKAQGIKTMNPDKLRLGKFRQDIYSGKTGVIRRIDNHAVSKIARVAGAPLDKSAGIYLHKKHGHRIKAGEKLFTIYSSNMDRLRHAKRVYEDLGGFEIR